MKPKQLLCRMLISLVYNNSGWVLRGEGRKKHTFLEDPVILWVSFKRGEKMPSIAEAVLPS